MTSEKKDKPQSGTGTGEGAAAPAPVGGAEPAQGGGTIPIGVPVSPEEYRKLKEQARKPDKKTNRKDSEEENENDKEGNASQDTLEPGVPPP